MPREFSCRWGKVSYRTPQDAYRDLSGIRKKRNGRAENHIYRCPYCGRWHMTSENKDRRPHVYDREKNSRRWRMEIYLPGRLGGENEASIFEVQDNFGP